MSPTTRAITPPNPTTTDEAPAVVTVAGLEVVAAVKLLELELDITAALVVAGVLDDAGTLVVLAVTVVVWAGTEDVEVRTVEVVVALTAAMAAEY